MNMLAADHGSGKRRDAGIRNVFVDRQNLTRFRNQLEKGVKNEPARSLLLDLLVEQEKRFGN